MAAEERRKQKEQIKILKQQVGLLTNNFPPLFLLLVSPQTQGKSAVFRELLFRCLKNTFQACKSWRGLHAYWNSVV